MATTMNKLQAGQRATVHGLGMQGGLRYRLLDLGLTPGTVVERMMSSPSGDPTCYRVRGAMIALRSDDAALVEVEV